MVEWIAFSFIQKLDSKNWKTLFENTPFLVRHVFKDNFRTPVGITAITAGKYEFVRAFVCNYN